MITNKENNSEFGQHLCSPKKPINYKKFQKEGSIKLSPQAKRSLFQDVTQMDQNSPPVSPLKNGFNLEKIKEEKDTPLMSPLKAIYKNMIKVKNTSPIHKRFLTFGDTDETLNMAQKALGEQSPTLPSPTVTSCAKQIQFNAYSPEQSPQQIERIPFNMFNDEEQEEQPRV